MSLFHSIERICRRGLEGSLRIRASSADCVRRESSGLEPYFLCVCVDVA